MAVTGFRQEVLNVELARLLAQKGIIAEPETRMPKAMPDVLVVFRGLRLIIEGEVSDQPNARDRALRSADERIEKGIAQIGVALVYPANLRAIPHGKLAGELAACTFNFAIRFPPLAQMPQWQTGSIDLLRAALEQAFFQLASEDDLKNAMRLMSAGVNLFTQHLLTTGVATERISEPLGIVPKGLATSEDQRKRFIAQLGSLIIMNSLLFQEELARADQRVKTLATCMDSKSPHKALLDTWDFILTAINYRAVFDVARKILSGLPADVLLDETLKQSADKMRGVARLRVALQHDLTGRLFHLLLGDIAGPLGAFYTSVPAATLLMRLAFDPKRWNLNWAKTKEISQLHVGDFACGTGTLLMASTDAIVDNFLRSYRGQGSLTAQRRTLVKSLLAETLWGLDVLQSAIHLTATTLALPAPEITLRGMNLYAVDMGVHGRIKCLGSLDLFKDEQIRANLSLFPIGETQGQRVTIKGDQRAQVDPPKFNLICMNPPFTRTCGDNLLFGSLSSKERAKLQKELQRIIEKNNVKASVAAGLGSVFLALGDAYLQKNGRLAFVLPKALLSGVQWQVSRELLKQNYVVEVIITSNDPRRWNFSENTDLSETMFIARKKDGAEDHSDTNTIFINLWENPDKPLNALLMSDYLRSHEAPQLERKITHLWLGKRKVGESYAVSWRKLQSYPHWLLPVAFAQSELVRRLISLQMEQAFVSDKNTTTKLALCPLGELGNIGPDRRRIWATFECVDSPPGFPAYWGNDSRQTTRLEQDPNSFLIERDIPKEPQKAGYPDQLKEQAGNILIAERMWLNTNRLVALFLSQTVLSNVWWPFRLDPALATDAHAKTLILWLNSTLGLFLLIGNRVETRGAWVALKKPMVEQCPVLDLRRLSSGQLSALSSAFDELKKEELLSLAEIGNDPIRKKIDQSVSTTLGLPDLGSFREQLAIEPILTLIPIKQERNE